MVKIIDENERLISAFLSLRRHRQLQLLLIPFEFRHLVFLHSVTITKQCWTFKLGLKSWSLPKSQRIWVWREWISILKTFVYIFPSVRNFHNFFGIGSWKFVIFAGPVKPLWDVKPKKGHCRTYFCSSKFLVWLQIHMWIFMKFLKNCQIDQNSQYH